MTQKLKAGLSALGFILLIVLAVIAYNALKSQAPGDVMGADGGRQKAENFTVTDADGNSVKLSDLLADGRPVVLNFWASWCGPCRNELPAFEKLYQELGADVRFVMVNLTDGQRETKDAAAKFIQNQGYTFPVYFDTAQAGAIAYAVRSIPITFFIDKDGYLVSEKVGEMDEATLRDRIGAIWKT